MFPSAASLIQTLPGKEHTLRNDAMGDRNMLTKQASGTDRI
jgi:hypothetical protein